MKTYEVTYKFSDVIEEVEAESLEEAQEIADSNLKRIETYCYETEIEEV